MLKVEMGPSAVKERVRSGETIPAFVSAAELRQVLDRLLLAADADPEVGPRMRSARASHRIVFSDLGVILNVTGSEEAGHSLRWKFSDEIDWKPSLTLEMDSAVANRYLQGRESLPLGVVRGNMQLTCSDPRAALALLPTSPGLFGIYRRIVAGEYPHLQL